MRTVILGTMVLGTTLALASGPPLNAATQAVPATGDIIAAAEKYLADVDRDSRALFAEEKSQQTHNLYNSKQEQRLLRSNVLMFRDGGDRIWFRDVVEVNGLKVVTEPDRLMALVRASVSPSGTMPVVTPLQIVSESAKQQYGGGFRVVNQPGAALDYLRPTRPEGLAFRSEGWKSIDGTKVVLLSLKDAAGGEAVPFAVSPVQARFWIEPASGQVLQTELEFIMLAVYRTKVTVRYGLDKVLNLVVPVMMNDEYENRGELVTGRAEYRGFRQVAIDPSVFAIRR
jgi:hypothetical protein